MHCSFRILFLYFKNSYYYHSIFFSSYVEFYTPHNRLAETSSKCPHSDKNNMTVNQCKRLMVLQKPHFISSLTSDDLFPSNLTPSSPPPRTQSKDLDIPFLLHPSKQGKKNPNPNHFWQQLLLLQWVRTYADLIFRLAAVPILFWLVWIILSSGAANICGSSQGWALVLPPECPPVTATAPQLPPSFAQLYF